MHPFPLLLQVVLSTAYPHGQHLQELISAKVDAAVSIPGASTTMVVERVNLSRACVPRGVEVPAGITRSGRIAVAVTGDAPGGLPCSGVAWVSVKVTAPALVATRNVRPGGLLDGSVVVEEREVSGSPEPRLTNVAGMVASRFIAQGTVLDARHGSIPGPEVGEAVRVLARSGGITIATQGRVAACRQGRACATLPGGRRVEGVFHNRELWVEAP